MDNKRLINMKAVEEIWLKKEVYGGYSIEIHMMSGKIISRPREKPSKSCMTG